MCSLVLLLLYTFLFVRTQKNKIKTVEQIFNQFIQDHVIKHDVPIDDDIQTLHLCINISDQTKRNKFTSFIKYNTDI